MNDYRTYCELLNKITTNCTKIDLNVLKTYLSCDTNELDRLNACITKYNSINGGASKETQEKIKQIREKIKQIRKLDLSLSADDL